MADIHVSISMGVMKPLLEKLATLMGDEYKMFKWLRKEVPFLKHELSYMNALLEKMDQANELDLQARNWKKDIIEMSYDIEDYIDFVIYVDKVNGNVGILGKASRYWRTFQHRRHLANQIQEIKALVIEAGEHRKMYMLDRCISSCSSSSNNLALKLLQLLQDEYKLQKGIKVQVESLAKDLEGMHLALCKVAQVPDDQLDPHVKLWASEARKASQDMEEVLDTLLLQVDGGNPTADANKGKVHGLLEKLGKMFCLNRPKASHEIAGAIKGIKKRVDEMAMRRGRVDDVVANSATITLGTKVSKLVGIDEPRDELINLLALGDDDDASDKKMKIVAVVGCGGLGKTTLAKVVYDKLTADMNMYCKAFVLVGRNPDLKKVFRDILLGLDKTWYMSKTNFMTLNEGQLVEEIQAFLMEKRYFIVIDDLWEERSWEAIKNALEDNNLGSKIMITTRRCDVVVHYTYKIMPLNPQSSKLLFNGRIFGSQDRCPEIFSKLSDKILRICDGVPLAIITIASLLANKSYDITEWQEVCSSIGSGPDSYNDMYNDMRKILSLSYYDLPSHLKTCFLYLSMYPEDYEINKDGLIWRWICEGFIQSQEKGDDLYELGKRYFNELINRSLVQPVVVIDDEIYSCRVHGMILDLICSLSREENFVTVSDDVEQMMSLESKRLRRLSLKSSATWPKKGVEHVRSIAVFRPSIDLMPSFSYPRLRVLDLEGCSLRNCGGSDKLSVRNFILLRYLGLRGTGLKVLPGGIEKLQLLQVLKMDGDIELPESVFRLRRLMCLEGVRCCPRPGNLLSNLTSLQVLDTLYLDEDSVGVVEALGHLTQLTVLEIFTKLEMVDQRFCDALMNSMGNLSRLQFLRIMCNGFISWKHLGISPASLPHLTYLDIMIHTVGPEDIQIIGKLPNLVAFQLEADNRNYLEQSMQKSVVSADAFPRLRRCFFRYVATVPSMFTRGAMPWVEELRFCLRAKDFFSNPPGEGLEFDDLAMDHFPSLQTVTCFIHSETDITGEEEAAKLREALQHAADVHPNHPELSVY